MQNSYGTMPDLSVYCSEGNISADGAAIFKTTILEFYAKNRRDFVWRNYPHDPYHILVSEIMLQQTQTDRVKEKFVQFIRAFPHFEALAQAPFGLILQHWQGLGYSRRALALHAIAKRITFEFNGRLPCSSALLQTFPSIGPNTAGSICAFAFNSPEIFIETNIRAVYIYAFFRDTELVHDKELLSLIAATVDIKNSREWYYALMDYGAYLKKHVKNPNRKSAHHAQQKQFEGSERQIRGMILRALISHGTLTFDNLASLIPRERSRIERNLFALCSEGFIRQDMSYFSIT